MALHIYSLITPCINLYFFLLEVPCFGFLLNSIKQFLRCHMLHFAAVLTAVFQIQRAYSKFGLQQQAKMDHKLYA